MRDSGEGLLGKARHSAVAWSVVSALLVGGCGENHASVEEPTVGDSAGITIVEHPAGAMEAAPAWRLTERPALDIGTVDGPEATRFHRLSDAARLPDGRIAVANAGSSEIRLFGPDGDHLLSFGSEGEGPGEFRGFLKIEPLAGDTLLVWDMGLDRLSVFAANGAFARAVHPQLQRPNLYLHGALADGSFLFSEASFEQPGEGVRRIYTRILRLDRSGQTVDSAGWYPATKTVRTGPRGYASPIYSPRTRLAASADGIWVGPADGYEVRFHGPRGELRRIVRWKGPDRTVTDELREAWVRLRVKGKAGEERRRARRRAEEDPIAERRAAYEDLIVDESRNLWVRGFTAPATDAPVPWTVFDADGRLLARVHAPRGLHERDIGEDYVLGSRLDEMDVVHVRLYGLTRTGGSDG